MIRKEKCAAFFPSRQHTAFARRSGANKNLEQIPVSAADRALITHGNAEMSFRL